MSSMRNIRIEKVTLNIGAGKNQDRLEKAFDLLKMISNRTPVKTTTQKRINAWGLRPGLPIGVKVTLRKSEAEDVFKRLVEAKDFELSEKGFDENGNIAFGLTEYVDIPGMKYVPEIGILGLQVCVTLARPGFRIKNRKIQRKKIPKTHKVSKEESINYVTENFKVKVRGKE
ncbi:50S ribosomal protein L5 [Candidatus Woesearchaeota archaeon]|nr:50S ribosomal protein L5 [Candidatus Woesearchaeota archaeon]